MKLFVRFHPQLASTLYFGRAWEFLEVIRHAPGLYWFNLTPRNFSQKISDLLHKPRISNVLQGQLLHTIPVYCGYEVNCFRFTLLNCNATN